MRLYLCFHVSSSIVSNSGLKRNANGAVHDGAETHLNDFLGCFRLWERAFSVTLFIPKDAYPRVLGHFVCPCTRGASEDFILNSYSKGSER